MSPDVGGGGGGRGAPIGLMIGGGAALVVTIAAVIGLIITRSGHHAAVASVGASAETTMDAALRATPCAWLTDRMSRGPDGLHLELSGAAGDPAAAVTQVTQALDKAGAPVAAADHSSLRTLPAAACDNVSAVAQFHAASAEDNWIEPQAALFHFQPNGTCGNDPNQATSVITVKPPTSSPDDDVALFRMEDTGAMTRVFAGLAEFKRMAAAPDNGKGYLFEDLGTQGLRVSLCEKSAGLKGVLLVRGKAPFELGVPALTAGDAASPAGLAALITTTGKAQGWRTQMAWYDVDSSGGAPNASGAAGAVQSAAESGAPAKPGSHYSTKHTGDGSRSEGGENSPDAGSPGPASRPTPEDTPTTF